MNRKLIINIILLIFGIIRLSWCWENPYNRKYKIRDSAKTLPERLLRLMEIYHLDAAQRNTDLNEMRFMYEESPHYEQGYLMSEILERYRKMVMNVKRPILYVSDNVYDTLKRVELVQKLYFEIYHLVNMAHEITRKYKYLPEFSSVSHQIDMKAYYEDKDRKRHEDKMQKEEKKKRDEFMKKLETLIEQQKNKSDKKKLYNKWWPTDYGWEIDYYW